MLNELPTKVIDQLCQILVQNDTIWSWYKVNSAFFQAYKRLKSSDTWYINERNRGIRVKNALNTLFLSNACSCSNSCSNSNCQEPITLLIELLLEGPRPGKEFIDQMQHVFPTYPAESLSYVKHILHAMCAAGKTNRFAWLVGMCILRFDNSCIELGITNMIEDYKDGVALSSTLYTLEPIFKNRINDLAVYWATHNFPCFTFLSENSTPAPKPIVPRYMDFDEMQRSMCRAIYEPQTREKTPTVVQTVPQPLTFADLLSMPRKHEMCAKTMITFPVLRNAVWVFVLMFEPIPMYFVTELSKFPISCDIVKYFIDTHPSIRTSTTFKEMVSLLMEHVISCDKSCILRLSIDHEYASQICQLLEQTKSDLVQILISCLFNVMSPINASQFIDYLYNSSETSVILRSVVEHIAQSVGVSTIHQPSLTKEEQDAWQADINKAHTVPSVEVGSDFFDDLLQSDNEGNEEDEGNESDDEGDENEGDEKDAKDN